MGLAVVESLVNRGWNVAILDKDRSAGEQVARRYGKAALFFDVDVTNYDQQANAFVKTWDNWGTLDLGETSSRLRKTLLTSCSLCQRRKSRLSRSLHAS